MWNLISNKISPGQISKIYFHHTHSDCISIFYHPNTFSSVFHTHLLQFSLISLDYCDDSNQRTIRTVICRLLLHSPFVSWNVRSAECFSAFHFFWYFGTSIQSLIKIKPDELYVIFSCETSVIQIEHNLKSYKRFNFGKKIARFQLAEYSKQWITANVM